MAATAAAAILAGPAWLSEALSGSAAQVQWVLRRLQFSDYADVPGWFVDSISRCRAPRFKETFANVTSLPTHPIENCVAIRMSEFLGINVQPVDISYAILTATTDVILLSQKRGAVYQVDVVNDGDATNWDVIREATRSFGGASCLDESLYCDLSTVVPILEGFMVVDNNRIQQFNMTWVPDDSIDARTLTSTYVGTFGKMNAQDVDPKKTLAFPKGVAEYRPYNRTFISETFELTDMFPLATNRFLAVSDTGNHRVLLLNVTRFGQFDYVTQFGTTGKSNRSNIGLNWPWGIATFAPAWESQLEPVFANIFVADRQNDRIVKLDMHTPYERRYGWTEDGEINYMDWSEYRFWDQIELRYGGEYPEPGMRDWDKRLQEPVSVGIYRHYLIVCEAQGNTIKVLMVDYTKTNRFIFVTTLTPAPGVQLTGNFAVSARGYIWYTFMVQPMEYGFASLYIKEALRESHRPTLIEDFRRKCFNKSEYDVMTSGKEKDITLFVETVGYALNISRVNWKFPYAPNFIDVFRYNATYEFNEQLFNDTVYLGAMVFCGLPPLPTPPPMMSGDKDGWTGSKDGAATAGASRLQTSTVALPGIGLLGLPKCMTFPPLPAFMAVAIAAWELILAP